MEGGKSSFAAPIDTSHRREKGIIKRVEEIEDWSNSLLEKLNKKFMLLEVKNRELEEENKKLREEMRTENAEFREKLKKNKEETNKLREKSDEENSKLKERQFKLEEENKLLREEVEKERKERESQKKQHKKAMESMRRELGEESESKVKEVKKKVEEIKKKQFSEEQIKALTKTAFEVQDKERQEKEKCCFDVKFCADCFSFSESNQKATVKNGKWSTARTKHLFKSKFSVKFKISGYGLFGVASKEFKNDLAPAQSPEAWVVVTDGRLHHGGKGLESFPHMKCAINEEITLTCDPKNSLLQFTNKSGTHICKVHIPKQVYFIVSAASGITITLVSLTL